MWGGQNSWRKRPDWRYLVGYLDNNQFKIHTQNASLPDGVCRRMPWAALYTTEEKLHQTQLPVVTIPEYVKQAMKFSYPTYDKDNAPTYHSCPFWEKLYPHQKAAVTWTMQKYQMKVVLCDEMGAGKTFQALALASVFMGRKSGAKMLILCPAFLQKDWKSNVEEYLHPYKDHITLLSYDKAKNQYKELKKIKFDIVVCDEVHQLKDPKTKRFKRLAPIIRKVKAKVLLTGTPCTNRSNELYAPLHMLHPKIFPKYKDFCERYYCRVARKSRLSEELSMILPYFGFIRRTKADVLDLPPKLVRTSMVVDEKARVETVKLLQEMRDPENQGMSQYLIGQAYHKLASIKANSVQVAEKFKEVLRTKKGAKKLVFCHHIDMMLAARKWCEQVQEDMILSEIHGGVSMPKRNEIVRKYQKGEIDVLICTMQAAGVGLTLTAATEVIFLELNWVPGLMRQCEDRAHRIGQREEVHVTRIACSGSLDEWILKCENGKKKIHKLLLSESRKASQV